ncbi:aminotransferase family protein [Conexibacter woesei]|uniref:Aminotransferase class-III n=1 Tax=Conexibacter woesei (strain DSM 14684 / CCUG 47730 / CIP 108061 / JCM 11494 / NBRC 100937 / ID131577) TaxID=469383 RepID=D3F4G4_CONWI|nr:aminotransferase class III-fold pyridoxal phosphate-dependent enzyme [Conexibacter woesei]ADB50536.1 aminotransferase class-III [Conexibacter woesei DSM 14684]
MTAAGTRGAGLGGALLKPRVGAAPEVFVRGEGVDLIAADGRRVLDACSGVGVTCLGHTAPSVVARMAEQAAALPYVHALRFETPPLLELAERVVERAPEGIDRALFVSGGSEAVETAIKLARQYWLERGRPDKWRVVGCRPSYHGNTLATLSAGWHERRRVRHAPLLLDFAHVPAPDSYRGCERCQSDTGCTAACADALDELLVELGPETFSCFLIEPVAGAAGGATVPPAGYLERIREICDRHEILLVADETITGFGRTGRWFGVDWSDARPDAITFGKGISGGFAPLAGIGVSESIAEAFIDGSGRFEHNFTMSGQAIACAVGCAVIEELESQRLVEQVARRESALRASLETLLELDVVGDVRGRGYLFAVELVADRASKRHFDPSLRVAERAASTTLEEGAVVYYGGGGISRSGDFLLVMPPFTTPVDRFDELAASIRRGLLRLTSELAA